MRKMVKKTLDIKLDARKVKSLISSFIRLKKYKHTPVLEKGSGLLKHGRLSFMVTNYSPKHFYLHITAISTDSIKQFLETKKGNKLECIVVIGNLEGGF